MYQKEKGKNRSNQPRRRQRTNFDDLQSPQHKRRREKDIGAQINNITTKEGLELGELFYHGFQGMSRDQQDEWRDAMCETGLQAEIELNTIAKIKHSMGPAINAVYKQDNTIISNKKYVKATHIGDANYLNVSSYKKEQMK